MADHDLGFGESVLGETDPVLKDAAKILRLIHLKNLRELQSDINNTIEIVQRVIGCWNLFLALKLLVLKLVLTAIRRCQGI